jgi:REP element-mobilizing transposase RayT
MSGWNKWYHVNGNTYGTWLPGDPRGWRSVKHKRHVEGDYRNPPPPGTDAGLHAHAKKLLVQPPVFLTQQQRELAGHSLVDMLFDQRVEVIAASVSKQHFHLMARFSDNKVRPQVGRAKKHASFVCRDHGFQSRIWTTSVKVAPVEDRSHQVNVFNYICRHKDEGAWTWTFRDGLYWPTTIHRKSKSD